MFKRIRKPTLASPVSSTHFASATGQRGFRSDRAQPSLAVRSASSVQEAAPEPSRKATEQPADIRRIAAQPVGDAMSRLPHQEKVQRAFGHHDLSTVRAFAGPAASRVSRAMNAEAFASGEKMVFRSSAPSLHTVAHETAHVIQQRAGLRPSGGVGREGDALERQADAVAKSVARGVSADALLPPSVPALAGQTSGSAPTVQRLIHIGREPKKPNDFREITRITGSRDSDRAGRKFDNNNQSPAILRDNRERIRERDLALKFDKEPKAVQGSDLNSSAILDVAVARDLAPEIDHIVEKREGGSTANDNARVLSKGQNNLKLPAASKRPDISETIIRVYKSYEIKKDSETGISLEAGTILDLDEAGLFFRFQTGKTLPSLDSFDGAAMINLAEKKPGEGNGVSIEEPGVKSEKKRPAKSDKTSENTRAKKPRAAKKVAPEDSESSTD